MAITKWHKIELFLIVLAVILIYLIPLDYVEGRSFCIFYNLYDIKCFGCGFSRAFFNMTRLNIIEAIVYNKLILILGPFIITMLVTEIKYLITSLIGNSDNGKSLFLKFYIGVKELFYN
ncbi:MAG: DUF2752 domain-containing protein [Sarcina sp.]